ncbi:MAG: metallophosphatase family protein [Bacteroidetes bacterium]|nr:metallophosphatase family protein [Bacteroidota bacterium]
MKIAIISDIHSNLEALQSTLTQIDTLGVTTIYCLGDIVGYGANPNECVEIMRERNIPCIAGNHDKAVIKEISIDDFSAIAKEAVHWTRSVLSDVNRTFLEGLEYQIFAYNSLFVHSSPDLPQNFRYILSPGHAIESFKHFFLPICFIGHTHRPAVFCEDGFSNTISLGKKFIVNVGSIGQPRDGDRRGCCVVFDTDRYSIEHLRIEYDVDVTRKKIIEAGLPQKLGDRLLVGI